MFLTKNNKLSGTWAYRASIHTANIYCTPTIRQGTVLTMDHISEPNKDPCPEDFSILVEETDEKHWHSNSFDGLEGDNYDG